jgi:hypothetical protein
MAKGFPMAKVSGMGPKKAPTVAMPKLKGITSPKKLKDSRIYKKSVLKEDPSQFNNVGFGMTGMDGEN